MIIIRVVSFNGQPPAQPLGVDFDELGGTIGRSDTNQLVLPDPERHVSRLQARIVWRNGRFEIVNAGANPLDVAGSSVGNGSAVAIRAGDRITMGGYVLEVAEASPAAASGGSASGGTGPVDDPLGLFGVASRGAATDDPFADILAGAAGSTPARAPAAAPAVQDDPFAAFEQPSARPSRPEPSPTAQQASVRASPGGLIPDDFDPFADPFALPPVPKEASAPDLGDLGFGPGGESVAGPGINTMFGLGAGAKPTGTDPFADSALGAPPPGREDDGAIVDPLVALSGAPVPEARPAAVPDQVPELRGAYRPPPATLPDDAFLSWEQPKQGREAGAEGAPEGGVEGGAERPRVDIAISFSPPPGAAAPQPAESVGVGAMPAVPASEVASAATPPGPGPSAVATPGMMPSPVVMSPSVPAQDADALLAAFLRGVGMPELALPRGLTPEAMEAVGRLLREATQGTLDLLLARAVTKREVRAEVTMIVSNDNNPLKFSPNVDVALTHLLAPRGRGFLPPVEAMRDAYDDLRSHQLGFMAGMRAALAGVLHRFDPAVLEQRLTARSVLDSLLPMNRRARLWDLYTELYRDIASEAEDDFHALFGREFLRAYEEQIERMHARDE